MPPLLWQSIRSFSGQPPPPVSWSVSSRQKTHRTSRLSCRSRGSFCCRHSILGGATELSSASGDSTTVLKDFVGKHTLPCIYYSFLGCCRIFFFFFGNGWPDYDTPIWYVRFFIVIIPGHPSSLARRVFKIPSNSDRLGQIDMIQTQKVFVSTWRKGTTKHGRA